MYLRCLRKIILTSGTICWEVYQPIQCHVLSPTEEVMMHPKSLRCWLTCNKDISSRRVSTCVISGFWMKTTLFWFIVHEVVIIPASRALKMGQIGCPKTLVRNHHYPLHNSPEKCSSHLLLHNLATGIYLLPNLILPITVTQTSKKIMSTLSFLCRVFMSKTIIKQWNAGATAFKHLSHPTWISLPTN